MRVKHFKGVVTCWTNTDDDGPCIVSWVDGDGAPNDGSHTCDGWISGGVLFLPLYDDRPPGEHIVDGRAVADAQWYEVSTGMPAAVWGPRAGQVVIPPGFVEAREAAYFRD